MSKWASLSPGTRFVESEPNTTKRPFAEIAELPGLDVPPPLAPFAPVARLTSVDWVAQPGAEPASATGAAAIRPPTTVFRIRRLLPLISCGRSALRAPTLTRLALPLSGYRTSQRIGGDFKEDPNALDRIALAPGHHDRPAGHRG